MRKLSRIEGASGMWIAIAALAFLGCSEPDWVTTIGTLNADSARVATLTAPTHVTVGTSFVVTVQTVGPSNCTRPERTDLSVTGSLARLVPYDQVPAPGQAACFRNLAPFSHSHAVQFEAPGQTTLRVIGYFGEGDEAALDSVEVGIAVDP